MLHVESLLYTYVTFLWDSDFGECDSFTQIVRNRGIMSTKVSKMINVQETKVLSAAIGDHLSSHPTKRWRAKDGSSVLVLDDQCPKAMSFKCKTDGERKFDMPNDFHPTLGPVLKEHKQLFRTQLGKTDIAEHVIDTGEALPVKVPPRPVPFHYNDRVHTQLQEMARDGIIRPSSSPWRFPAVYVPKDNGEIRISIDYVQLNKVTMKDSYPVTRADGQQQTLANKKVFSKITETCPEQTNGSRFDVERLKVLLWPRHSQPSWV